MLLLCPSDPSVCIPLYIVEGPSETGPRLGGRPPAGIRPPGERGDLQYFLTIPLAKEPPLEVSVFVAATDEVFHTWGRLNRLGLVQVVVHKPSHRGETAPWGSALSEHPLMLDTATSDWVLNEQGERLVNSAHKIGGTPFLFSAEPDFEAAVDEVLATGFYQVLQIDFPGSEGDTALVEGKWPLADGMFHLFGKPPFQSEDWRWCWEF